MTSEERRAWLSKLKEGDEVFVRRRSDCNTWMLRCDVELCNERYLVINGTCYLRDHGGADRSDFIAPVDDEEANDFYDRQVFGRVVEDFHNWKKHKKFPIATVRKILAVLAEAEQETKENG